MCHNFSMLRPPAVAGQFYYADAPMLEKQVEGYLLPKSPKEQAKAILVPHAGLIYSGAVAGAVYSGIVFPDTFVLIGPNHTGLGQRVSLMSEGGWEIPTGTLQIDSALSGKILSRVPFVLRDTQAHRREHSIEVQLPFIASLSKTARIVPIAVMSATLRELKDLGEGIAKAVSESGYPVVVAASSDMSHFVPDAEARRKDGMAIEKLLALDPEGLYEVVKKEDISMCGFMPAVAMLSAARALGAKEARLLKYATSAETSRDYDYVVGYAGVVIK